MCRDPRKFDRESGLVSPESSEYRRKILHIGVGAFALLLRYLTWWQAAIGAFATFLFNAFVLPSLGGRWLWREEERARGHATGIVFYPVSVLVLILLFHERLHLAAAMWGILAIGDGMASIVGTTMGTAKLPWNPHKSWAGTIAMIVFGATGGIGLALWVSPGEIDLMSVGLAVGFIAVLAALTESFDSPLDDNISVPIGGGLLLYLLLMIDADRWSAFLAGDFKRNLLWAVGVNAAFATVAFLMTSLDRSGCIGAFLVGSITYLFGGYQSFLMLLAFFVLGSAATKLGYGRKAAAGLAQDKGGRRSMKHVLANGGIVPLFAVCAALTNQPRYFFIGIAGAMATAAADTLGSEIGQLYGRRAFLITNLRPVPRGTDGAVSIEGTLAGAAGSAVVAVAGCALHLYDASGIWIVVVAAFAGTIFESFIGATLESRGYLTNELTNFLNTVAGASAAIGMLRLVT